MKIWTSKEVSEFLKLSEQQVRRLAREGVIPSYRVGGMWRFDSEEITSMLWARSSNG